ncbi:MAG: Type III pantothenate kinase [Gammaproteobacteria bacterium]|nr:Type III pantothenate kinase [Gammaproteobacteria bacterium]
MILLVDTGNSRIKWTICRDGALAPGEAATWVGADLAALFEHAWGRLRPVRAIWVANVSGPGFEHALNDYAQRRLGLTPRYVRSSAELGGISNTYVPPERLGVDRLLAMIAARRTRTGPVMVADCGTAVTVDFVDAAGSFGGGVIAPGLALMHDALSRGTHALPLVEPGADPVLALSTDGAMASGCLLAIAGLIGMVANEIKARTGLAPECVLTGGDAPRVIPKLPMACHHDPDLVLRGLAVLAGETE